MSETIGSIERDAPAPFAFDELDALFWPSRRASQESAWHGHVSFAHWLVQKTSPRIVVELGTHNGVSFAAFCNAVVRSNLPARCFAVDSWGGDDHAGFYGENVYADVSQFNRENFPSVATLLRCFFDDALPRFPDHSVDLLHIDGLHTYEAVKHDFDTWLPKMSDRGIVLFHDTDVYLPSFGVWKLWEELSARYPSFTFKHSAGLGVLAVGSSPTGTIASLCACRSSRAIEGVQRSFAEASAAAHRMGKYESYEVSHEKLRAIRPEGRNIALGMPASQSSYFSEAGCTPQGAVDGVKTGGFGFHTELEPNPWWMVDLGSSQPIHEVIIYNRVDALCRSRARWLVAMISNDGENWAELYAHDGTSFGGVDGYPLRITGNDVRARFIRLKLNDTQFLHLDEVEVYSTAAQA